MCGCCAVMVFLGGSGWTSATGTKNQSILLVFFIDMIYYSYEIRVQNFVAQRAVVVKLWQFWVVLGGFLLQVQKIDQFFYFFV